MQTAKPYDDYPRHKTTPGTCYPMMHTASAVRSPHVDLCTYSIYSSCIIIYTQYTMQLPEPCHGKILFQALSTPPSSALSVLPPLPPFYHCFSKSYKSQTDLGQGRMMIKPRWEPFGRHGNRILLSGPRRRLTCRIITRTYVLRTLGYILYSLQTVTEGKGMGLVSASSRKKGRRIRLII